MTSDEEGLPVPAGRWLAELGDRLRSARKELGVSATAAALAAGVSRVTWHRMERGSAGVAVGSYARALDALGLLDEPRATEAGARPAPGWIPTRIAVGDYPELRALAWSLQPDTELSALQALRLYEGAARHLDTSGLTDAERTLLNDLREALGDDIHP